MKILLDENIDVRFKVLFAGTSHEVHTVRDMAWNGINTLARIKPLLPLLLTKLENLPDKAVVVIPSNEMG